MGIVLVDLRGSPIATINYTWRGHRGDDIWLGPTWDMVSLGVNPLIARFMGPTWGPSGAERTHVGPMLAPCILLSGSLFHLYPVGGRLGVWENFQEDVWVVRVRAHRVVIPFRCGAKSSLATTLRRTHCTAQGHSEIALLPFSIKTACLW